MELNFKKNLGTIDRVIRILLGIIFIGIAVGKILVGWVNILLIVIAVLLFVEAFFSY